MSNKQPSPSWAVDATPSLPKPATSTCALNFNDGTDYECPTGAKGVESSATSPPIDLTKAAKPTLRVQVGGKWKSGKSLDILTAHISVDGGEKWVQLGSPILTPNIAYKTATLDLSAYKGAAVLVRFVFLTTDCIGNSTAGPFLDILEIFDAAGCSVDAQCYDGNAGYNLYGQLGDGTTTTDSKAKAMTDGSGFVQAITYYHGTCGLRGDGSVACTGYNTYGTAGEGTKVHVKTLTTITATAPKP